MFIFSHSLFSLLFCKSCQLYRGFSLQAPPDLICQTAAHRRFNALDCVPEGNKHLDYVKGECNFRRECKVSVYIANTSKNDSVFAKKVQMHWEVSGKKGEI